MDSQADQAPEGWRVLVTPEHDVCYFNEATGDIRWELPTEAADCTPPPQAVAFAEDTGRSEMQYDDDREMQSPPKQKPGHFGQPLGEFWPKPKR